ncbi:MAG: prolyl oligopeptidase family serine peptidase [Planctomycetes bacterium]|nr:prolyl oligopeptidase family serine peptidase [Planctomycetota bacterium]
MFRTALSIALFTTPAAIQAQAYGPPDRSSPADEMIQSYLAREADRLHGTFLDGVTTAADWSERRVRYRQEYLHMLGLWPLPERTDLKATVTGTLAGDGFTVEMLHYQSRPRLYVTANLYRPHSIEPGERLPAVLYVCGHSGRGRNGNKTAFQSHGMWFARHGYVCLVLDTLQLGEIAAIHHGTYREGRWWWHSRGYTPAGVECWNGIRGIDYLLSRPDVDPERIAVTGISGGGAATFWIAAADERARVAVPVSGMADLPSYVGNRVINGHCDCMFLYNTFQWPWTRIAALIGPRPMLFVNSDQDRIFPMDANERISARLERFYSLFGASDVFDTMVSIGGHAYREDLRRAIYRFINTHLKNDPRPVEDSEIDLVVREEGDSGHPIPPERLRVFPRDEDLPEDQLNTAIDEHFVPLGNPGLPEGDFEAWRRTLLGMLRGETSLRTIASPVPPATSRKVISGPDGGLTVTIEEWTEFGGEGSRVETEPGISVHVRRLSEIDAPAARRIVIEVTLEEIAGRGTAQGAAGDAVFLVAPRGGGACPWTRKNPPNYVERSHVLLGHTVDTGRVRDIIAAARLLKQEAKGKAPVRLTGRGAAGILAAYAALLEPEVDEVAIADPPLTHMDPRAPVILNVLRVCDIPDILGLLAPRRLEISGVGASQAKALERARAIYAAAGAGESLTIRGSQE